MPRDPRAYLWDVPDALRHVESFTAGATLDSYRTSTMLRSAVERQLEITGEALSAGTSALAPALPPGSRRRSEMRRNVTIDWTMRENVRAQLRVLVKRILRKYGYPPDKQERATQLVLEQAEVLSGEWATA